MVIRPFLHPSPVTEVRTLGDVSTALKRLWESVYPLRHGKLECVAEVTLTASAASTVFKRLGISRQSVFIFDPLTANAAAELAAGTLFITQANRINDQVTITHANNAQADRNYLVAIIG